MIAAQLKSLASASSHRNNNWTYADQSVNHLVCNCCCILENPGECFGQVDLYCKFNTLNNIYDNRSVRAQNMANVNVPGCRRDVGTKSVGSAVLAAEIHISSSVRSPFEMTVTSLRSTRWNILSQTGSDLDAAYKGTWLFLVVVGPGRLSFQ